MGPGERVELKKRIADELAKRPMHEIDLILTEFNQSTHDGDMGSTWDDDRAYVLDMLWRADDDDLQSLGEYLLADHRDHVPDDAGPWRKGRFRLFLSHLYGHRVFTTEVKKVLGWQGIDCFVAHTDIKPSKEWVAEIELALFTCDALAAFLHDGFAESAWCDQEVGFAVGRRKPVLPVMMSENAPYGFLGKYQAIKCGGQLPYQVAGNILKAFFENPAAQPALADAQMAALCESPNFETSNTIAKRLRDDLPIPIDWTPERLDCLETALGNPQVSNAYDAKPWITAVLASHGRSPVPLDDEVPF
jgi:hypothetical protein